MGEKGPALDKSKNTCKFGTEYSGCLMKSEGYDGKRDWLSQLFAFWFLFDSPFRRVCLLAACMLRSWDRSSLVQVGCWVMSLFLICLSSQFAYFCDCCSRTCARSHEREPLLGRTNWVPRKPPDSQSKKEGKICWWLSGSGRLHKFYDSFTDFDLMLTSLWSVKNVLDLNIFITRRSCPPCLSHHC